MTFFYDNLLLIALALVSGGLLFWPMLRRGGGDASLSPLEATQLINHRNAIVVDVRDEKAFAEGSLAGARNIPADALATRAAELSRFKARPILVVCAAGQQSARAIATFKEQGFADAYTLAGGIAAWRQASLPLVQGGRGDTNRPAKDAGRKKSDNRGRPPKSTGAVVPSAVEPASAIGEAVVPAADAIAAGDDASPAKAV